MRGHRRLLCVVGFVIAGCADDDPAEPAETSTSARTHQAATSNAASVAFPADLELMTTPNGTEFCFEAQSEQVALDVDICLHAGGDDLVLLGGSNKDVQVGGENRSVIVIAMTSAFDEALTAATQDGQTIEFRQTDRLIALSLTKIGNTPDRVVHLEFVDKTCTWSGMASSC